MENYKNINWYVYVLCFIIFLVSSVAAFILTTNEILKGILTFPGVGALFFALYQILRDSEDYRKKVELKNKEQDFILGTATHMADVVYDKHVLFCEDYIKRAKEGIQEMIREGPSQNTLNIGSDLVKIRIKYAAWLTKEIEEALQPFEQALINIGAKKSYIDMTREDYPHEEKRRDIIDEIYRSFGHVLGHEKAIDDEGANVHIDRITEEIRDILGIKIFTELRLEIAKLAIKRIKNK